MHLSDLCHDPRFQYEAPSIPTTRTLFLILPEILTDIECRCLIAITSRTSSILPKHQPSSQEVQSSPSTSIRIKKGERRSAKETIFLALYNGGRRRSVSIINIPSQLPPTLSEDKWTHVTRFEIAGYVPVYE